MDGSVSVSAQSTQRTFDQFAQLFGKRTQNSVSTQSSLFEQLLSIPVVPQSLPPQSDSVEPEDATSESSAILRKADAPQEVTADDEEDDTVSETTIPHLAVSATNQDLNTFETSESTEAKSEAQTQIVETNDQADSRPTEIIEATAAEKSDAVQAAEAFAPSGEIDVDITVVQAPPAVQSKELSQPLNQPLEGLPKEAQEVRSERAKLVAGKGVEVTASPQPEASDQRATTNQPVPNSEQSAQSQSVAAEHSSSVELHAEDASSHRSNRRGKWFERDAKSDVGQTSTGNEGESVLRAQTDSEYGNSGVMVDSSPSNVMSTDVELVDVSTHIAEMMASTPLGLPQSATQPSNSVGSSAGSAISKSDGVSSNSLAARITAGQESTTGTTASTSAKSPTKDQANRAELTQQERVRLVQRVARSFNRITAEGGQINLRLHPQNLGSLNMQVRIEGRTLSAKLTTETSAARDAILQDLPALRQRLADQGYDVAKFQVEVAGNGADASFAQTGGQSQYGQSGQSGYKPGGYEIDYRRLSSRSFQLPNTVSTPTTGNLSLQTSSGIDLHA